MNYGGVSINRVAVEYIESTITFGKTNAINVTITIIEKPIKIKGQVNADITFCFTDAASSK